jgi:hypothetical protein
MKVPQQHMLEQPPLLRATNFTEVNLGYSGYQHFENHSEALAAGLLEKTQNSPLLPGYRNVLPGELEQRVYEIYRHLADWLLGKSELDVEKRYTEIGAKRALQNVPL